jgi:hypothetical protein
MPGEDSPRVHDRIASKQKPTSSWSVLCGIHYAATTRATCSNRRLREAACFHLDSTRLLPTFVVEDLSRLRGNSTRSGWLAPSAIGRSLQPTSRLCRHLQFAPHDSPANAERVPGHQEMITSCRSAICRATVSRSGDATLPRCHGSSTRKDWARRCAIGAAPPGTDGPPWIAITGDPVLPYSRTFNPVSDAMLAQNL